MVLIVLFICYTMMLTNGDQDTCKIHWRIDFSSDRTISQLIDRLKILTEDCVRSVAHLRMGKTHWKLAPQISSSAMATCRDLRTACAMFVESVCAT